MKTIQDQVRAWLLDQQDWLQEAADRLLKQGQLSDVDIQAVTELLKTQNGQKIAKHRTFDELLVAPALADELRLSSISQVFGIENLAPRDPLAFGPGNLVVIYGHNGSGKSSYTRILKKASGKPRANTLKPNVFQAPPAEKKCTIGYQLGAKLESVEWLANGEPIDSLRAIDIFDSIEANHYLTKENSAAYMPPLVLIFEALALACDRVKARLQTEQSLLVSILPALPTIFSGTDPARRYSALPPDLNEATLGQIITWTEDHARDLEKLTQRLKVADPVAVAKQRRATKAQATQIREEIALGMATFKRKVYRPFAHSAIRPRQSAGLQQKLLKSRQPSLTALALLLGRSCKTPLTRMNASFLG